MAFTADQGSNASRNCHRLLATTAMVRRQYEQPPVGYRHGWNPWYREQFADAHAIVVSDQARAGLDIVTTG